jgi:hypothetical protein
MRFILDEGGLFAELGFFFQLDKACLDLLFL